MAAIYSVYTWNQCVLWVARDDEPSPWQRRRCSLCCENDANSSYQLTLSLVFLSLPTLSFSNFLVCRPSSVTFVHVLLFSRGFGLTHLLNNSPFDRFCRTQRQTYLFSCVSKLRRHWFCGEFHQGRLSSGCNVKQTLNHQLSKCAAPPGHL